MTELWALSASRMVELVASGDVSALELVDSCLSRQAAVNSAVNAVVVSDAEQARQAAQRIDNARARKEPAGALAGLPFTAKLDYDVQGQATSQGTSIMRDATAHTDGPIIARMRGAGAVLLGRTNEPDFGYAYHTDSTLYGPTLNPWDPSRSPGGSSGGEGAAISTGISPLGLGSDIGGSIRGPASFNGVVGFKPGLGRYPDALESMPEPPIHEQLFVGRGPLARSVADISIVDPVLRGLHPVDPWSAPTQATTRSNGRCRVGVVHSPTDTTVAPPVASLLAAAAQQLASLGYVVEETHLPRWQNLLDNYTDIMGVGFGVDRAERADLHPATAFFLEHIHSRRAANPRLPAPLPQALAARHRLASEFHAWHERYDVLMMPTWTDLPFVADALTSADGIDSTTVASRHLYIFNLLGLPALSMPIGMTAGLPVGAHISSLRHHEQTILDVAADLEWAIGPLTPIDPR